MANFKEFELNNSQVIFGGVLQDTEWSGHDGSSGTDLYDTERRRVIYAP